jgi:fibronectin-binding autotransporter adhesin
LVTPVRRLRALLLASGAAALLPGSAAAIDIPVSNDATLRAAITSANAGDRIVFQNSITLSADLPLVQTSVAIVGNGNSLSGNNQFRGLFIGAFAGSTQVPVAVTVQDLAITNTTAQGGAGATGGAGAGGGAGLGGALFVTNQATVTVSNVSLTGNAAIGGNGGSGGGSSFAGGGGMGGNGANGGNGGAGGGGGGLGRGANGGGPAVNGQAGIASGASPAGIGGDAIGAGGGLGGSGGASAGGGGGGAAGFDRGGGGGGVGGLGAGVGAIALNNGGHGGFGGGGGGGTEAGHGGFGGGGSGAFGVGGNGGFGGGGGGNSSGPLQAGFGGFGAGSGRGTAGGAGGGGGLGAGGGIFVQQGGTLTLGGPLTVNGNSVTGGTAGGAAGSGSALGGGLFLQGNGTLTLSPGAGQTQTVSDAIADQTGSGGTGGNAGSYNLVKTGAGTTILSGSNTYSGGTAINGGALSVSSDANLGVSGSGLAFGGGTLQAGAAFSSSRNITLNASGGTVDTNGFSSALAGTIGGTGGLTKTGVGTLTLGGVNNYSGGTTINAGTLAVSNGGALGTGSVTVNGGNLTGVANMTINNDIVFSAGSGAIAAATGTTLTLAPNTFAPSLLTTNPVMTFGSSANAGTVLYQAGTSVLTNIAFSTVVAGGTLRAGNATFGSLTGNARATTIVNSGATLDFNDFSSTITNLQGGGTIMTGAAAATVLSIGSGDFAGAIGGAGGLAKTGAGTLTLSGLNTYSGGTTVSGGTLVGNAQSLQGNILNNASVVFNQTGSGTYAGVMSGSGGMTVQGGGLLNLTGNSTYTGPTTVSAGTLAVNGSLASSVNLGNGATLMGNGSMGGLASNGGVLAPGNSIGTLTINGSLSQLGGVYQVEANAQGQSDRIDVTGTATIGGGATVQVLAQPGTYAANTTYTILRANGGVNGTYSGVSSNFAFLTPSLSYDANDVFLTLSLQQNAFSSFGGNTPNQRAVGAVLDQTFGSASGDYATVLNAIATLGTLQGPLALNAISGQQYAGFSNTLVQSAQLFLGNFSNQAGGTGSGANKVALAEACVAACDVTEPAMWGAWGGAIGGTGTIAGNNNAGTFTYTVGGFSGGLDRKFTPNFLAGVTVGYLTGGQWTGGFDGRSVTDTVQAGVYASFIQGPAYVDGIAGYAYSANRMWRSIAISGLQPRTAFGQTGANQFLGQLEAGYRIELGGTAAAYLTPFARLQGSTATQNAFTETGAQSLNLSVAAQTTNSLRTVFGAQLGAALNVGLRDRIAAQLKLGWSHEYADTARPVTASFVGAPALPFTVQGATPTRDGAVIGFAASTALADALGVYLKYEGTISGQDSSHALTAGLRMTW